MRYGSGVRSQRAHGVELVDAIRRTGIEPLALVRIGEVTEHGQLQPQTAVIPAQGRTYLSVPQAHPGLTDHQDSTDAARPRRFSPLHRAREAHPTTSATVAA